MRQSGLFATETGAEIHLYGWNDQGGFWHGPTEVAPASNGTGSILRKLRTHRARSTGDFTALCAGSRRGLPYHGLRLDGCRLGHGASGRGSSRADRRWWPSFRHSGAGASGRNSPSGLCRSEFSGRGGESRLGTRHPRLPGERFANGYGVRAGIHGGRAPLDSDTSIVTSAFFENLAVAMLQWLCPEHAEMEAGDDGIFEACPAAVVCTPAAA